MNPNLNLENCKQIKLNCDLKRKEKIKHKVNKVNIKGYVLFSFKKIKNLKKKSF